MIKANKLIDIVLTCKLLIKAKLGLIFGKAENHKKYRKMLQEIEYRKGNKILKIELNALKRKRSIKLYQILLTCKLWLHCKNKLSYKNNQTMWLIKFNEIANKILCEKQNAGYYGSELKYYQTLIENIKDKTESKWRK